MSILSIDTDSFLAGAQKAIPIPSFTISRNNRPESLIHCFMGRTLINLAAPPATLRAVNGQVYIAVYDSFVLPEGTNKEGVIQCIVSYQAHTYGNFAIIRPFVDQTEQSSKEQKTGE